MSILGPLGICLMMVWLLFHNKNMNQHHEPTPIPNMEAVNKMDSWNSGRGLFGICEEGNVTTSPTLRGAAWKCLVSVPPVVGLALPNQGWWEGKYNTIHDTVPPNTPIAHNNYHRMPFTKPITPKLLMCKEYPNEHPKSIYDSRWILGPTTYIANPQPLTDLTL